MRQAQFDEAAAVLLKAGEVPSATALLRMQTRLLRQQCQRYLGMEARLPALLQGKEQLGDTTTQIEFARLCLLKKHYAAAARFFRDAFAAKSKLAEIVTATNRYTAACAAAQAGCGQGKDADQLDDKERARWRRQALDWLREDLTEWGKALDNGSAQAEAQLGQRLLHWQTNDDLAGLREPGALEAMSPDERKECLALWQEVAAVLRRAQPTR
jgi:serine/threonine-protein kinase